MYKILTRLCTRTHDVYRFLTIDGEEYATDSLDEVKEKTLEVLDKLGYENVRIVDDKDYYIDITSYATEEINEEDVEELRKLLGRVGTDYLELSCVGSYDTNLFWGKRPEEEPTVYSISLEVTEPMVAIPHYVTNIKEYDDVEFQLEGIDKEASYHLVVDGLKCDTGIPSWIKFNLQENKIIVMNVMSDHVIEIIKD
jgi:hypothetical protein